LNPPTTFRWASSHSHAKWINEAARAESDDTDSNPKCDHQIVIVTVVIQANLSLEHR
jgi:hypothetical protein